MSVKHPNQPVIRDADGEARFKQNNIVRYLLDSGASSLNSLAQIKFDNDDRNQLAQLLGFSVDGFAELDYADPERIKWADEQSGKTPNDTAGETLVQALLGIIRQAREVNQDGVRFRAEVESRITDQVAVTYRLEIEVSK